jgi:hypothetical protein
LPVWSTRHENSGTKDFLIGSRAAWQDINLKGGLRGFNQSQLLEVDGTPEVSKRMVS